MFKCDHPYQALFSLCLFILSCLFLTNRGGQFCFQFICARVSYFVFCLFAVCYSLVVSTSAIDCLERLVYEMTCYVSSGALNPTHSLTVSCKTSTGSYVDAY